MQPGDDQIWNIWTVDLNFLNALNKCMIPQDKDFIMVIIMHRRRCLRDNSKLSTSKCS